MISLIGNLIYLLKAFAWIDSSSKADIFYKNLLSFTRAQHCQRYHLKK